MIRTVIIEDEPKSLSIMKTMLQEHCPDVSVIATAGSVDKGVEVISRERPDLVFLDIALSKGNAFDLLRQLPQMEFSIVFTTAFKEYALEAIKVSAVDYLLKPIDVMELREAVKKATTRGDHAQRQLTALLNTMLQREKPERKVLLPTFESQVMVDVSEIIRCEAFNSYTYFHIRNQKTLLVSKTLKDYDELLQDRGFFRVHQSHLINLDHVKKYVRSSGSIVMTDETSIPVSRRNKEAFLDVLRSKSL